MSVFYGQPILAVASANQITQSPNLKSNKVSEEIKPAKTFNDEPILKARTSEIGGINSNSKQRLSSKQMTQGTLQLQDLIRTSI